MNIFYCHFLSIGAIYDAIIRTIVTYYCTYVVSIEFHIVLGFGVVGKYMDFLRMKQIIGQIFVFPQG